MKRKKQEGVFGWIILGMVIALFGVGLVKIISMDYEENKKIRDGLINDCINMGYDGLYKWDVKTYDASNITTERVWREQATYVCEYTKTIS